jgi:hypothetical protein
MQIGVIAAAALLAAVVAWMATQLRVRWLTRD